MLCIKRGFLFCRGRWWRMDGHSTWTSLDKCKCASEQCCLQVHWKQCSPHTFLPICRNLFMFEHLGESFLGKLQFHHTLCCKWIKCFDKASSWSQVWVKSPFSMMVSHLQIVLRFYNQWDDSNDSAWMAFVFFWTQTQNRFKRMWVQTWRPSTDYLVCDFTVLLTMLNNWYPETGRWVEEKVCGTKYFNYFG